ncbi:hypothetical protein [Thioalbus denitrificans]|uniref:hypothetical protein n=1 Tax=Thioalbus denitrificans TaxID=547122 RepID=UPI0011C03861|nr:hypothetical protein [Thioalbus denitrificans]
MLAVILAICCWGVALMIAYSFALSGSVAEGSIKVLASAVLFGSVSSFVVVKGFVPPWLMRLIPFVGSATAGQELRKNKWNR